MKEKKNVFIALIIASLILTSTTKPLRSESFKELIAPLLKTHNTIKAAKAGFKAAEENVKVSRGAWFPTATFSSHAGYEKQNKTTGTDDTDLITRKADVSINQLVWDFGATNSTIEAAKFGARAAKFGVEGAKQGLILKAIMAYLNVYSAARVLNFARDSEANIKRQTELESSLVKKGAGLSSDVLQAKATLAGAQARRAGAEGALAIARNAYRAVFHEDPSDLTALKKPKLNPGALPATLQKAIKIAYAKNPSLRGADMSVSAAMESVSIAKSSSFFPKFDVTAATGWKDDDGGAEGSQEDRSIKFQMSFPFNLGLTAINTLKSARYGVSAVQSQVGDARDAVENLVRDSWANKATAIINYGFISNQASISSEFLVLARKERKAGNKTLLDILGGETALINANSDAAQAEVAVLLATFSLLSAMGTLDLNVIQ